jgi:hypothetical protein
MGQKIPSQDIEAVFLSFEKPQVRTMKAIEEIKSIIASNTTLLPAKLNKILEILESTELNEVTMIRDHPVDRLKKQRYNRRLFDYLKNIRLKMVMDTAIVGTRLVDTTFLLVLDHP